MASLTTQPTENKLFIENYKILHTGPEHGTKLSHNYHTVDLVTALLTKMSMEELLLAFNVDRSGSMSTKARDGYSSLEHTLHTAKNIIHYLEELKDENPNLNIRLLINAFDNKMKNCGYLNIGDKNTKDYIANLEKLHPRGTTNISDAFDVIKQDAIYNATDESKKAHILMTDGQPNGGKTSAEGILESNPGGSQVYIGYGTDHNAELLQKMAELSNGAYHFVDSVENAGMVYGEIIHGLLYAAVKDITVTVKGAEVYDFTKNTWTNSVKFNSFASEHTQSLILRSSWDSVDIVSVNVNYTETGNGVIHSKTDTFNCYNCTNGETKQTDRDIVVEKQMFRQQVLDGLWRARYTKDYDKKQKLKTELITLEKNIKEFMKTKNLEDDAFMQKLATDLYVAYNGIDSYCGAAFIGSRLNTQGNQRAYDVNNFDQLARQNAVDLGDAIFGGGPSPIYRGTGGRVPERCSYPRQQSAPVAPIELPKPNMVRQSSCYTTPTQASVMRHCSQQMPADMDDIEEEN